MARVFVGHDWAEAHHDVFVEDAAGRRLAAARLPEGVEGVGRFHELVAEHVEEPGEVLVATETDRGLFVGALVAAGYEVVAVNPLSTSRYRERLSTSGAKSDPGDARVLAELARVDGHNHRRIAGDTQLADAVKVLARAHQTMIWTRQRHTNQIRSTLREFYPAALHAFDDLASSDALAVLAIAPTPMLGRGLSRSKIASALRRGGRQRRIEERAAEIQAALRADHLEAPAVAAAARGASIAALVAVTSELAAQIARLERELAHRFDQHPDAKIIRSLPGLGTILGARALGEFGDDPNRFHDAKSRKNYASTSPITRASGKHRVVLARYARNRRLADLCYLWAFAALTASPGARSFYDQRRAQGDTHNRALRALANRLVGILHGCLTHGTLYDEHIAWAPPRRTRCLTATTVGCLERRPMEAAFFDLDKTVIAKASMVAFGRPFYREGLISRRLLVRALWGQLVYMHLGASEEKLARMRESVLALTKGWEQARMRTIVEETLSDVVEPIIYAEAADLIEHHRANDRLVVIVSASPAEIVEPLGRHLGVDRVIASRAEVDGDGRYTGEMAFYSYGPFKADGMRELAAELDIDLGASYAYSDSATDLPMLEVVGHPVVVNPDRVLARVAKERGWEVRQFVRPVRLRDRVPVPPAGPTAAGAAALGALAGGIVWFRLRRLDARRQAAAEAALSTRSAASWLRRTQARPGWRGGGASSRPRA